MPRTQEDHRFLQYAISTLLGRDDVYVVPSIEPNEESIYKAWVGTAKRDARIDRCLCSKDVEKRSVKICRFDLMCLRGHRQYAAFVKRLAKMLLRKELEANA